MKNRSLNMFLFTVLLLSAIGKVVAEACMPELVNPWSIGFHIFDLVVMAVFLVFTIDLRKIPVWHIPQVTNDSLSIFKNHNRFLTKELIRTSPPLRM